MKNYLLTVSILITNFIFGQKFLDPPKLDVEDLKLTSYAANPSEPAEVLYRSYHYYIDDSYNLNFDVISRVKIYKKDDAKKFLDEEIEKLIELNRIATSNIFPNKIIQDFDNYLKKKNYQAVVGGKKFVFPKTTKMYNAGAIGLNIPDDNEVFDDALMLTDYIYPENPSHVVEQFAFCYLLQSKARFYD